MFALLSLGPPLQNVFAAKYSFLLRITLFVFLRHAHLQSIVSSVCILSLFIRPIIIIVVAVDIPVLEVAVDTISVAIETCGCDNYDVDEDKVNQ